MPLPETAHWHPRVCLSHFPRGLGGAGGTWPKIPALTSNLVLGVLIVGPLHFLAGGGCE